MKPWALILFCCFLLLFSATVEGQVANKNVALLAVECEATNHICDVENLVRFRFRNGQLLSKDIILTSRTDRVRFDLGENRIYLNRYVITRWGDVVDIQNKELLHEGDGEYVGAEGNRIIQRLNKTNIEGYFYYDIAQRKYARLRSPGKWALPGVLSPDQTKSVEGDDGDIWLHHLKGKRKLLGSDFWVNYDAGVSGFSPPPFLWLDNDRVLTQKTNGKLVIIRIDGTVCPVVDIPIKEEALSPPSLERDGEGRIIYECSGESFAIDAEHQSYLPYAWLKVGFQFEAENERNLTYGHVIRFQGAEIGRLWGSVWRAPAIDGYVAFEYGDIGSNLGYPKGIQVWSSENRKWTIIDEKWLSTVIGWIEE